MVTDQTIINQEIKIVVKTEPKGKERPLFTRRGGFVRAITPKQTREYENIIRLFAQKEMKALKAKPLQCAVVVMIDAYRSIPKSYSKLKREKAIKNEIRPTTKPDADNIAKLVLDALNEVAYIDDKQIISLSVQKYYAEKPRIEITIKELK